MRFCQALYPIQLRECFIFFILNYFLLNTPGNQIVVQKATQSG